MIRAITGARDTTGGKAVMVEKRFTNALGRRDFLRYAGYTGMTVSMAGVLAACREAETPSGGAQGSAQASIPPIEQEPGGLQVLDWSGYGNGDYLPRKGGEVSVGRLHQGHRRHAGVHPVRERRCRVHEGRRRRKL